MGGVAAGADGEAAADVDCEAAGRGLRPSRYLTVGLYFFRYSIDSSRYVCVRVCVCACVAVWMMCGTVVVCGVCVWL